MLALTALGLLALPAVMWAAEAVVPTPNQPKLGTLEQESVDDAMAGLGKAVDPHPEGKRIGQIIVINQDVFSKRDWWFQLLNYFHRTTRANVMQRELLMKTGDPYDEAVVQETIRNLQAPASVLIAGRTVPGPDLSSVVVILPLVSPRPGEVDLLVVTRDVWSLRFNTNFEIQQQNLVLLETSLSENNLFGWRKYLSLGFTLDQGAMAVGPTYLDPNIKGTRLTLYASTMLTYARNTREYEGNRETFAIGYPLYSLRTPWGGSLTFSHQDTVARGFRGNNLALQDLAATPDVVEKLPYIYRRQTLTLDASGVRSFGSAVIQRVSAGYLVDSRRSSVLPDFPDDEMTARLFLNQFAPLSERRSEPYLRYQMFTPRYAIYRNLNTFDLRENRQLGPSFGARVGYGVPLFGADFPALTFSASASWAIGPGGWYGIAQATVAARRRDGTLIDKTANGSVYLATPIIARFGRLIFSAETSTVRADTGRTLYLVGGANGLRGYTIGEFQGTTMALGNVELRTAPVAVFSQRLGAVLFYDVGGAGPSYWQLPLFHDVGVGLRWLIPQLNSAVIRIDWAFATQNTIYSRAGWPGRFMAGFAQVF